LEKPTDFDFIRVIIFRSTEEIKENTSISKLAQDRNVKKIYEGINTEYTDVKLDNSTTYYYAITAYDRNYNYSTIVVKEAQPEAGKNSIQVKEIVDSNEVQTTQITPNIIKTNQTVIKLITANLYLGLQNKEVKKLQEILAQDKDIYPEGITTGYYGNLTTKAIQRFQKKHNIIDHGTPETTGYGVFGPVTRTKFNQVYGNQIPINHPSLISLPQTISTITPSSTVQVPSSTTVSTTTASVNKPIFRKEIVKSIQNQISSLLEMVSTLTEELNKRLGV